MGQIVQLEVSSGVATISLDSPDNRNALSRQLVAGCHEALDAVDEQRSADPDAVRAIVLTHTPPAFCAGADLKEQGSGPTDPRPMVHLMGRLMDLPQPTIAAVRGPVRAGGIGLMAACDLVVVRDDVTFAFTEVRIGVVAAIISVPILRRASSSQLAAAFLTGETFDAHEARRVGLVTHVAGTDEDVERTVTDLCEGIRHGAPTAVAETKKLLHQVPTMDRETAFTTMAQLSQQMFGSDDAKEGIAAFKERRKPNWHPDA